MRTQSSAPWLIMEVVFLSLSQTCPNIRGRQKYVSPQMNISSFSVVIYVTLR